MHRRWLGLVALVVVATFASPASAVAKRVTCACPARVVLPAFGATNVPINTKVWVLDHTGAPGSAATSLRAFPVLGEPALEPNTEYSPDGTRFTTGTARDTTPPAIPAGVTVGISVTSQPAEYMPIDAISLWGTYDADTALIKVDLWDGQRETTLYTTRDRTFVCAPGVSIRPGTIRVTIRAIDLAGNESPPFQTTAAATASAGVGATTEYCGEGPRQGADRHFRCGTGSFALLLVIPVVVIGLLIGLVIVRLVRNAKIRRTPPVAVGLLVAEAVVRMMLRGHLVTSALGFIAIGVSVALDSRGLGFALAVIPFLGLSNALTCKLALRRLDRQGSTAERRDTWLIVSDVTGETRLRSNERVFRAAVRAALPAASIERDRS